MLPEMQRRAGRPPSPPTQRCCRVPHAARRARFTIPRVSALRHVALVSRHDSRRHSPLHLGVGEPLSGNDRVVASRPRWRTEKSGKFSNDLSILYGPIQDQRHVQQFDPGTCACPKGIRSVTLRSISGRWNACLQGRVKVTTAPAV